MKTKTKLIATLMAMCLVISLGVIGILAVTSLNMTIGGNINFFADGVSFTVGEGKFYEENGTTLYTGITSQTGVMQGFSMDTDTKLSAVSGAIDTWSGLDLGLDNRGDAILKFNVANDMDNKELYIMFTVIHGKNTNNNMRIVCANSEKLAAGASKTVEIKFDILSMDINAGLEGFEIKLTFGEPVAVTGAGVVENQTNNAFANVKYTLNTSNKTATAAKASNSITGDVIIMDRVYSGGQEYTVTKIGYFSSCNIQNVILPNTITSMESGAFNKSTIISINIPASLPDINGGIFCDCKSLQKVSIEYGITRIGYESFMGCTSLVSIVLPATVTSFGGESFKNCTSLTSMTLYNPVPMPLQGDRPDLEGTNCNLYVPAGSVEAYKAAAGWSAYASRIFAIA